MASAGALMVGQPGFWPCTPYGCMKMLESIGYNLRGKHAVVIGRSNIVGKSYFKATAKCVGLVTTMSALGTSDIIRPRANSRC